MRATSVQTWLDSYCNGRDGVVAGIVVRPAGVHDSGVAAAWPGKTDAENTELLAAAEAALQARSPVVKAAIREAPAKSGRILSLPVRSGKDALGAIALELSDTGPEQLRSALADFAEAARGLGAALERRTSIA